MASSYPTGLDAFTTGTLTGIVSGTDHGNKGDALNKIEAELGTEPSGAFSTLKARLDSGDILGSNVRFGRTTNVTSPDFHYDYGNEKLSVRSILIADVGDVPDLALRRAGPDAPAPAGAYAGPHLALGSGVNFGGLYGEAWGATATLLNGSVTLPQGTITVDSTTGFPASGTVYVGTQAVAYTSKNATQFLGCTGGAGLQADNTIVSYTDGDWDGATAGQGKQGNIYFRTTELQTLTARGTKIVFAVAPNGSDVSVDQVTIDQDGKLKFGPDADCAIYRAGAETIHSSSDFGTVNGKHFQWSAGGNEQTTVGAAGGASALPATPTKYLKVKDSTGATLVIPAYAS